MGQRFLKDIYYYYWKDPKVLVRVTVLTGSREYATDRGERIQGFSISYNVQFRRGNIVQNDFLIRKLSKAREFTFGISLPYIWASTGNATILSEYTIRRFAREMLPACILYPRSFWRDDRNGHTELPIL